MRLVRRSDLTARPWKNGGGLTWEIAAHPAGAGFDTMLWRLSMAEVTADGPFSAFPGIDRTLTVLSGAGLTLDFAAGGTVTLDDNSEPFAFPGEAAVNARLGGGPILDFNVITRRGAVHHHLDALEAGKPAPEGTVALLARSRDATVGDMALAPGELLLAASGTDLAGRTGSAPLLALVLRQVR